jgi:uncharacterized protein (TIGR03067 family)
MLRFCDYTSRPCTPEKGDDPLKARWFLVVITLLLVAAGDLRDGGKQDQRKLQGTWKARSIEFHGRQELGDAVKSIQMAIADNTMKVQGNAPDLDKYANVTFKLDPSAAPPAIDITIANGEEKGTVIKGIYEVEDDSWRLCVNLLGNGRPTEFKSAADSQNVLAVFQRQR